MNMICWNAICFSVEFVKLFLVVVIFFGIRQHKSIYPSFFVSLLMIVFVSRFFDLSDFCIIIVDIMLLIVNAYEKKKAGMIVLSFMCISAVDMIFAFACVEVFHLDEAQMQENPLLHIGFDSFTLALLLLIAFLFYHNKVKIRPIQIKKNIVLYLIGALSVSINLSLVLYMAMGGDIYQEDLIIGLGMSSLVLVVDCILLIIHSNQNIYLKREAEMNANLLEAQKEYYTMLLEKENETRAFRHDIKTHLYCMQNLYTNKQYKELGKYFADMEDRVQELSPSIQTGNGLITAIVNDISKKFPEVDLQWTGMIPEELQISSLDICTIFYNLLTNAFEAVQKGKEHGVEVNIRFMESAMIVTIINPIHQKPQMVNGDFITGKSEAGHGYGIKNVKKCVEKNGGLYSVTYDDGYFVTELIIPQMLCQVG